MCRSCARREERQHHAVGAAPRDHGTRLADAAGIIAFAALERKGRSSGWSGLRITRTASRRLGARVRVRAPEDRLRPVPAQDVCGIRTLAPPLDSANYGPSIARAAVNATAAVSRCPPLPAGTSIGDAALGRIRGMDVQGAPPRSDVHSKIKVLPCLPSQSSWIRSGQIALRWAKRSKVPKSDVIRALIARAGPIESGEDLIEWVAAPAGSPFVLCQAEAFTGCGVGAIRRWQRATRRSAS